MVMSPFVGRAGVAAGVLMVLAVSSAAQGTVFTQWSAVSGDPTNGYSASGTLGSGAGSVSVTYTSDSNNSAAAPRASTTDLSNSSVFSPAGGSSESVIQNQNGGGGALLAFTNTVLFNSGVQDLALYFRFWRAGDNGGVIVPATYQLNAYDSSNNAVSYSFLSGDYASTPTITNNQFQLGGGSVSYASGIIAFNGAVSKVEWFITNTQTEGGNGLTTFGILPTAVPGSGLAAIGSLGLAGFARRRRR